jgi:hypothetical protein
MNIYKPFAKLGVPSSDITLYFINETKKKIKYLKNWNYKNWKDNDFLLDDIPNIKGFS